MSVVVTGAAGFIGRHVVRVLLDRGVDVVAVDRRAWPALAGERVLVRDLADRGQVTATVNLGTGTTHRLDHILAETAKQCGVVARVVVQPAMREDVAATKADTSRCREALGFAPTTDGFAPTTDLPALIARQLAATPRRASVVRARVLVPDSLSAAG